jgi:hypothetical protein
MIEGSGAGSPTTARLRIREAQKHTDPDLNPQHCYFLADLVTQLDHLLQVSLYYPRPNRKRPIVLIGEYAIL